MRLQFVNADLLFATLKWANACGMRGTITVATPPWWQDEFNNI